MHWIYSEFKPYCQRKGINLLKEDFKFIEETLPKIPSDRRRAVMRSYVGLWLRVLDECENAVCGDNLARRTANIYLRELTE